MSRSGENLRYDVRTYERLLIQNVSSLCRCAKSKKEYKTIRELLRQEYPVDSILGFQTHTYTQQSALEGIMNGNVEGFVAIEGGRETARDKVSKLFSFVPQRGRVRASEIGAVTRKQLSALHGERAEKMLRDLCSKSYTLTKSYADFERSGVVAMSTWLLRWLVEKRKFRDFKIAHLLRYRHRSYLASYLVPKLLKRESVKERIARGETHLALESEILKLLLNG